MPRRHRYKADPAPVALNVETCVVCRQSGIVAQDIFPFWWGLPIGHKWCHSSCAERYRVALAAAQRARAVEGSKPKAQEGHVRERESFGATHGDMARTLTDSRQKTSRS